MESGRDTEFRSVAYSCAYGAGPPAHEGANAPYAPVGRYPVE